MHIRPIKQEDIEAVIALARAMHAEGSGFVGVPFVDSALRTWLFNAVHTPHLVFCVVAEHEGEVIGGMLACSGPFIFSNALLAIELGIYLKAEHRGGYTATRLVRALETWAKERGCVRVQAGTTIGINDELAAGFYKKLGYKDGGRIFTKELS